MPGLLPALIDRVPLPSRLQPVSVRHVVRARRIARLCADRVFALESSGLSLDELADVARRELRSGRSPAAAWLDSMALAAIAAQRCLGQRPHLPQLTAAVLVWTGRAAEMPAGEGKTLALALAAVVHALAGTPVHLVHRDERMAARRGAAMRPLFDGLGIGAVVLEPDAGPPERRAAYAADVCYASARDLLFDSLRALADEVEPFGFRAPESTCALIDDLDAVLVDGATAAHRLVAASGSDATPSNSAAEVVTAQRYFRRYAKLGGLSSTLVEARSELRAVYGLTVSRIGSIYPDFRRDHGLAVVRGREALAARLVQRVESARVAGRPVLVVAEGGRDLWALAAVLVDAGVPASLVDAMPPEAAAAVIAEAGRPGRVTLCASASDIDLQLDPPARAAGGLAVIVVGLGSSRRGDRRLKQACGRQGHPGSIEFLVDATAPRRGGVQRMPLAATLLRLPLPAHLARALLWLDRDWQARSEERRRRRLGRPASAPVAVAPPVMKPPCPELTETRTLSPPHGFRTR